MTTHRLIVSILPVVVLVAAMPSFALTPSQVGAGAAKTRADAAARARFDAETRMRRDAEASARTRADAAAQAHKKAAIEFVLRIQPATVKARMSTTSRYASVAGNPAGPQNKAVRGTAVSKPIGHDTAKLTGLRHGLGGMHAAGHSR